jgi:tetratricopeptide (TPR) repeat protein
VTEHELNVLREHFPYGKYPAKALNLAIDDDSEWRVVNPPDLTPWGSAYRLKRIVVRSDLLDYLGIYEAARRWLDNEVPWDAVAKVLWSHPQKNVLPREFWKLWVWTGLAHVTSAYRDENYLRAEEMLMVIDQAVGARLTIEGDGLLGTRAHLEFLRGQVARQQHQEEKARHALGQAICLTARRFAERTPERDSQGAHRHSETESSSKFEHQRLRADWATGKILSIGVGWIAFANGALAEANTALAAGCSLLRGTNDYIHAAFANVLFGALQRASAKDEQALKNAIDRLEKNAEVLKNHPYRVRASYELALAYYKSKDQAVRDQARQHVRRVLDNVDRNIGTHGMRSKRWHSSALVLQSRIARNDGNFDKALRYAQDAFAVLAGTPHAQLRAEARMAAGEVSLARATNAPDHDRLCGDAIQAFREAVELAGKNPKVLAAAQLHLAAAHLESKQRSRALRAYNVWESELKDRVEHTYVVQLARELGDKLQSQESFYRDDEDLDTDWRKQKLALEAFFIRRARDLEWSDQEIATHLGIKKSSLAKKVSRLGAINQDAGRRGVGRPRQ